MIFLKKIISLFLAFIFTIETAVWAAPDLAVFRPAASQPELSQLEIPESLGTIQSRFIPESDSHFFRGQVPFIIHIQDAHAQPEAQQNIQAILNYLSQNYGLEKIAVEAAFGKMEARQYQFLKDPAANRTMAERLTQMGELTGAELFAMNSKKGTLHGVEDKPVYIESFRTFREVKSLKPEVEETLGAYEKKLEQETVRVFSKDLNLWMKTKKTWEEHHDEALDYFRTLHQLAAQYLKLDLADAANQFEWPNLTRLLKAEEIETRFNRETAAAQAKDLADVILKAKPEGSQFLADGLQHLTDPSKPFAAWLAGNKAFSEIKTSRRFFEFLYEKAQANKISLLNYPDFLTLGGLMILREELDSAGLFKELKLVESRLEEKIVKTDSEKKLLQTVKDFSLLRKLTALEMSREEYDFYKARKKELTVISRPQAEKSLKDEISQSPFGLLRNDVVTLAEKFYELSRKRDQVLIDNTLKHAAKDKAAVLITGGFHSEGLTEILKSAQIPHLVITPKISRFADDNLYEKVMMGKNGDSASLTAAGDKLGMVLFPVRLDRAVRSEMQISDASVQKIIEASVPSAHLNEFRSTHPDLFSEQTSRAEMRINLDETARHEIASSHSVTVTPSPRGTANQENPEFVIVDGTSRADVTDAANEISERFEYRQRDLVTFEAKGIQPESYRIVLQKETPRSEVRELTEAQAQLLDEVEKVYSLSPADKVYLKGMWMQQLARMQKIEDPNKKALLIAQDRNNIKEDENFILASHLTAEEREKLLGAFEYLKLVTPEHAETAKKVILTANSMDGGIGESLARALWLGQQLAARGISAGEVKLGAKGTDLGFDIEISGTKDFVSVAEAKIMQLIDKANANKYAGIKFQPLVNYQSVASYEKLLDSPYLYDRINPDSREGKNPRTIRQVMEAAGIEILPLLQQADLPRISLKTGDITLNQKVKRQPGGHGQWGVLFMYESFKAEIPQDGKTRIRAFYNGDNLNSAANEHIMGWMTKSRIPIVKLTTAATPIDKKGGKDGVRIVIKDGKTYYVPDQMEETVAKNAARDPKTQLSIFWEAGQEGGNGEFGKQPFNTNVIYINDSVLSPILRDLEKAVGADQFAVIISPTLLDQTAKAIEVDGEKFIPLDGAIGNVIHNLNSYFMLNQDNVQIKAISNKHGLKEGRLLYFVDVPRTEFFTPVKVATDMWLQAYSDYYRFNPGTMRLEDSRAGLTPPEFDLKSKGADGKDDKYWIELQNLVDAFGRASAVKLKSLTIDGKVLIKDAKLIGNVTIINETGTVINLNDPFHDTFKEFFENGKLKLANIEIKISADGSISIKPYLDEVAFRESFESLDVRISGLKRFSTAGFVLAGAAAVLAFFTWHWYPLLLTVAGLAIGGMFGNLSNYAKNELKQQLTKSDVVLVESGVSFKEAEKIANRLKALKFGKVIPPILYASPSEIKWDVLYDSAKREILIYPKGMLPPGVLKRSELRSSRHFSWRQIFDYAGHINVMTQLKKRIMIGDLEQIDLYGEKLEVEDSSESAALRLVSLVQNKIFEEQKKQNKEKPDYFRLWAPDYSTFSVAASDPRSEARAGELSEPQQIDGAGRSFNFTVKKVITGDEAKKAIADRLGVQVANILNVLVTPSSQKRGHKLQDSESLQPDDLLTVTLNTVALRSEAREVSHDVRVELITKLKEAMGEEADNYVFYPGGFASIDIMPKGVSKQSAIGDFFSQKNLGIAFYFGDEFFKSDKKTGNDTPLLAAKLAMERAGKKLVLFSVDEKPEERTAEAKENTIWVGSGPVATKKVLETIQQAIASGQEEVVIAGQGEDAGKNVIIDVKTLISQGSLIFDVDGTILSKKADNFSNEPEIRGLFAGLLASRVSLGIISGNSKTEQKERIGDHLKKASELKDLAAIQNLTIYVNGGATRLSYEPSGNEISFNLAGDLSLNGIQKVAEIVSREAANNFGLSAAEIEGWKQWFQFDGQFGVRPDFPHVKFRPWWAASTFSPVTADAEKVKKASDVQPLELSQPFIEIRDNVQLSIKLLPKAVDIPQAFAPRSEVRVGELSEPQQIDGAGRSFNFTVKKVITGDEAKKAIADRLGVQVANILNVLVTPSSQKRGHKLQDSESLQPDDLLTVTLNTVAPRSELRAAGLEKLDGDTANHRWWNYRLLNPMTVGEIKAALGITDPSYQIEGATVTPRIDGTKGSKGLDLKSDSNNAQEVPKNSLLTASFSQKLEISLQVKTKRELAAETLGLLAKRDELPEKVDLIIVFGSGDQNVAAEAAKLFKQGKASKILVSGRYGLNITFGTARPESYIYRDQLIALGVPSSAILIEDQSRHMRQNAELSLKLLQDRGIVPKTAVLIHAPKFQARGAQTARDVFGPGTQIFDDAAYIPKIPSTEAELDVLLADLVKEINSINQFASSLPSLPRLNELRTAMEAPRSEARAISVTTTNMTREQEIAVLNYVLGQLKLEQAEKGSGNVPLVSVISDQHGTIDKFDALIVDAIRQALPGRLPADFKMDPDKTLEEQLSKGGISINDLQGKIFFHNLGDITDRGPYGIKVFRRSMQLINAGLSDFVIGNHDLWTMMNLWGIHLPWYEGFKFYSYSDQYDKDHGNVEDLVREYHEKDPETRTKTWWAQKLYEFTQFHEKQQKERWASLDTEFNGDLDPKGKRVKGTGLYAQLNKEELTPEQKAAWDQFRGWYEKGNTEVYTGVRAVGLVSVKWWQDLLAKFEKAYANAPHAPPVERALELMRKEIIPALETNLQVRLDRGEWWARVFEAINWQNYASVEWWAKDWAYHKDWGTAVFEELNDELQLPEVRAELAAANDEGRKAIRKDKNKYKVYFDQRNYFDSPILQRMAEDYRTHFNLHNRDIYQTDYMHAFLPVDEKTGEFFFEYQGTEYRGKGGGKTKPVWEGLRKIGEHVRNRARTTKDLYDALSLVNSWYADATTTAKVPDVIEALKNGPEKPAEANGINRLFTGHLPFHEFSKFKKDSPIVNDGFFLGRRFGITDHGMGKRFGARGASVIINPNGIELRGFEHGEHKEIISSPRTVALENGSEPKVLFENKGIPREEFLPQLIKEVEARLKQLAGPVAQETAVAQSLTRVVLALQAIMDKQRGIVPPGEEPLFAEVANMVRKLTGSGVTAQDIVTAQGLLERIQAVIAKRGTETFVPVPGPAAEPLEFRYDSERYPLLLQEPIRMAINLGHYVVDEENGESTRILASNFSNKRKVAVNTVQNRVFDAYLREITGNPNVSLTDIYGVQDIRRFHVAILGQLHGRSAAKLEIEEEGGKNFLVVNGNGGKRHRIQIHQSVPTAESLKQSSTQYLIDFSDPELTGELEFKKRTGRDLREERLKALQQAAGLQKVFAFGDEEPANETVVAGINSEEILNRKDTYLPLASPVTLAVEQLKKAVMTQMPGDFDFAAGLLAARPVTGDSGHIQFLAGRPGNAAVVEYDIEKGAGSAFISFIPTQNSRFKAIAKKMYADIKALKDKKMTSKEREKETEKIKKKVIYDNFNHLIELAAKGPLGRYLRYAGEENLNSLTAMRERFAIVFDSQATTLRENGQVDLYFHFTDFGYASALHHLITDASQIDGTPVTPETKDQFEAGVHEGLWKPGTIPPNTASNIKKVVKDGEEIKFAIVGVRGRIGAPLHQQLLSDPNFIPSFYLGIEDIHTVLQQYKEDVTQGPRAIERREDIYIPEAIKDSNKIRFKGQKSGQYLLHPVTKEPLVIPYFHIRQRDGEEDEAFERRITETLGALIEDVEVLINASGFAMDAKDKYYNAFLQKNLKMVLFTAPAKGDVDITVIRGVNEDDFLKKAMEIEKTLFCSGASCTTTGLARALVEYVKFLENWGVEVVDFEIRSDLQMEFAKFVTHHGITPSQGPAHGDASAGKSLRGANGPIKAANLEATGADKVVKEVVGSMKGRSGGVSHRDGNFGGSVLDINATLHSKSGKYPTAQEINDHFKKLAQSKDLEGVLTYLPYLLSTAQIAGEKTASIFSADGTRVEQGNESAVSTIRVGYDNEWGYTTSQVHLVKLAALGRRGLATPENIRVASAGEPEYFEKFKEANTGLGLRLKRDVLYSAEDLKLSETNHAAFKEILTVLSRPVLSLRFIDEIPFALSVLDQAVNDLAAFGDEKNVILRDIESDLRDTHSEMVEFVKDYVALPRKEAKKNAEIVSDNSVEQINRLAQVDPKSPELADLGLGLLNRYDFEGFDRVSDVLLDSMIASRDYTNLKKYIDLVYQPIPEKLKLARRIYGITHQLQNQLEAKEKSAAEWGEKLDRQIRWHYKQVIQDLNAWARILDPEKIALKSFAEEKDFPMPSTAKFGEERVVAVDLVKDFKREILKTSKDLEMLQLRPEFQARVRKFNQKLIGLPFDEQTGVMGVISHAATLAMEESVPLLAYLISQYTRYGYRTPERDMAPLWAFMDMVNAADQPSAIYLLRLLGKIIFTHQSGKSLLRLMEAERVKSRQGDYNHGIFGVLRDQIHNLLGEHVLGLLERQFEYYRTGNKSVLHSPDYHPSIYKGRFTVPAEKDSRYPEGVLNELNARDDKQGSDFIRALERHVLVPGDKRNFYEAVRNYTDEELQDIIDQINTELGTNYKLTEDSKTPAAYLWIYRQLAGRFAMGNQEQTFSRFAGHYHSLYLLDEGKQELIAEFKKELKANRELAALQLLVEIKEGLKEEFSIPNPLYNRAAVVDRFEQEFGRSDVDNAEGGAIARDRKLSAYQAEFYLSQLEERLIQSLFRTRFQTIRTANLEEAYDFLVVLGQIGYLNGDYSIDQLDNLETLGMAGVDPSVKKDVLSFARQEGEQKDTYFKRLLRPTIAAVTETTPRDVIHKHLSFAGINYDQLSEKEERQQSIAAVQRQIERMNIADSYLRRMLDQWPASEWPARKGFLKNEFYAVLGQNSTPEEINEALKLGRFRLGSKGIGLVRALKRGIPVPPFAIMVNGLTPDVIEKLMPEILDELDKAIKGENNMGLGSQFAAGERPYYLSARASTYFVAPGQYLTFTNLGMTREMVPALAKRMTMYGLSEDNARWTAWDSYRRFLEDLALGVFPQHFTKMDFHRIMEDFKADAGVAAKEELTGAKMEAAASLYETFILARVTPEVFKDGHTAIKQVFMAADAIRESFDRAQDYHKAKQIQGAWPAPAVILQAMTYGNIKSHSGAGIIYTRDPNTWKNGVNGDYKLYAQGRDLADSSTIPLRFELIYNGAPWQNEIARWGRLMEQDAQGAVEMEVTVQMLNGRPHPWLLQVRTPSLSEPVRVFAKEPEAAQTILKPGEAIGVSGGAYRGIIIYDARHIPTPEKVRQLGADGVILITELLSPEDVASLILQNVRAVISRVGGYASHTADIARDLEMTAITGARKLIFDEKEKEWRIGDEFLREGDIISIDGRTGAIYRGLIPIAEMDNGRSEMRTSEDELAAQYAAMDLHAVDHEKAAAEFLAALEMPLALQVLKKLVEQKSDHAADFASRVFQFPVFFPQDAPAQKKINQALGHQIVQNLEQMTLLLLENKPIALNIQLPFIQHSQWETMQWAIQNAGYHYIPTHGATRWEKGDFKIEENGSIGIPPMEKMQAYFKVKFMPFRPGEKFQYFTEKLSEAVHAGNEKEIQALVMTDFAKAKRFASKIRDDQSFPVLGKNYLKIALNLIAPLRSEVRLANEAEFRQAESQMEKEAASAGRVWNAVRFVIQVAHGFVPADLTAASSVIAAYFKQVFGPREALANMLEAGIPAETQALTTRVQNLEAAARKNQGTSAFERRLVVLAAYGKEIPKISAEDLKAMMPAGGKIVLQQAGLEKNLRKRYEKMVRNLIRKSEVPIELKIETSHYSQPTVEGFEMLAAKYRGHVPVFVLPQSYEGNLSQLEGISNQAFVLTPSRTKAARYALSYLAGHMTPAALRKQVPDGLSISYRDEKSAVTMHVTNEARFAAFELNFAAERLLASAA